MIALTSIKNSIYKLLKSKYPNYKVHFDNVEKQDGPYFYVEFTPHQRSVDETYTDRTISVDITFFQSPDANGRVRRLTLYEIADVLDILIRPTLALEDKRFVYIAGADVNFVDDILHYMFDLTFTDAFTAEEIGGIQYELMQTLGLTLNGVDLKEED